MSNRERLIQIAKDNKLSHLGSSLTALPIIEEIYAKKRPGDKFVLSSGHAHLAHAVVMESGGGLDAEKTIQNFGIHCDRQAGCDCSTGSLGMGITIAVGMALADRGHDIYCLVSDGEMAEGSVWEALEIAHQQKLKNLILHFNWNSFGAYDKIDLDRLQQKLLAFVPDNCPEVHIHRTNMDGYPLWCQGLMAHYVVMDEEKYEEIKKCISNM